MDPIGKFLDIGCGSGELVIAMAERKVDSVGVDFAAEMIELCCNKSKDKGITNVEFVLGSIFDYRAEDSSFDMISGQGLIEYISADEFNQLIKCCRNWLRPGGKLVLGSRNRLFNLFSQNAYTELELRLNAVDALLTEAVTIGSAATFADAIEVLGQSSVNFPSPDAHPDTGIDVTARHQYTPGELIRLLSKAGFKTETIFPVHYQSLPPDFANANAQLHTDMAEHLFDIAPEDHRLIPSSSTFVIVADKV
ncbi:MAG: class I SAM-dependent methyltransferase [Rhodospirillales bacterium]|nr:class I SAM-dependent methyltransferase [Rhodospirillales bacterium]